eukprot:6853380-Prymnesium_polylepis.3
MRASTSMRLAAVAPVLPRAARRPALLALPRKHALRDRPRPLHDPPQPEMCSSSPLARRAVAVKQAPAGGTTWRCASARLREIRGTPADRPGAPSPHPPTRHALTTACLHTGAMPIAEAIYLDVYKGPADAIKKLNLPDDDSVRVQISIYLRKIKMSEDLQRAVLAKRQREDSDETAATGTPIGDKTNGAERTPVANEYRGCGGDFAAYQVRAAAYMAFEVKMRAAVVEAATLVKADKLSLRKAVEFYEKERGIKVSHVTIKNCKDADCQPPGRASSHRNQWVPEQIEKHLYETVVTARARTLPVYKELVIGNLMHWLEGTEEEAAHFLDEDGELKQQALNNWYYSWLKSYGLDSECNKPMEMSRAQWTTPDNLQKHYKIVATTAVETTGVAAWNDNFDETVPHSQMIKWTHPERVVSFDEKKMTLDQTCANGTNRTITVPEMGDDGTTAVTKTTGAATLVAGSRGDFRPLRPLTIFGSSDSYDTGWTKDGPETSVIDTTTGEPYKSLFYATKKGSMNEVTGLSFFKAIASMYPDLSTMKGKRVLVLCDGHGSHLTKEIIEYCREVGLDLVLRVPHTSQVTQNEDLINFGVLENEFVHQKALRLAVVKPPAAYLSLITLGIRGRKGAKRGRWSLNYSDLSACARPAFDKAFTPAKCAEAWEKAGLIPFTRAPYWKLKKQEARKVSVLEKFQSATAGKVDVQQFYCRSAKDAGDVEECTETAMVVAVGDGGNDGSTRVSVQRDLALSGPATSDEGYAIVAAKTDATRARKEKTAQTKRQRVEKTHAELLAAVPVARAALTAVSEKHGGDFSKLHVPELKAVLLVGNQPTTGNKPELVARACGANGAALLALTGPPAAANGALAAPADPPLGLENRRGKSDEEIAREIEADNGPSGDEAVHASWREPRGAERGATPSRAVKAHGRDAGTAFYGPLNYPPEARVTATMEVPARRAPRVARHWAHTHMAGSAAHGHALEV